MTASPGEVPFGDVHLAWNEDGLFLATIAMDYYAPELLGPLAEFPRSEAFRIALGIEAGGRTAPHRAARRAAPSRPNHPRQKPKLSFDAQICWYQAERCLRRRSRRDGALFRDGARPAAGDPEGLYPVAPAWAGGTAAPRRHALEIGVTAFYRSRWMSRSGLAPEIAMNDPASWLPVRLGGAARDWPAQEARRRAGQRPRSN